MLETAAAGDTDDVVGAAGNGLMRRCRALYAMAEVDDDWFRTAMSCAPARCCFDGHRWAKPFNAESRDHAVHNLLEAIVAGLEKTMMQLLEAVKSPQPREVRLRSWSAPPCVVAVIKTPVGNFRFRGAANSNEHKVEIREPTTWRARSQLKLSTRCRCCLAFD